MANTIMIQGTMSNSGKSFLAAALCRIFKQDDIVNMGMAKLAKAPVLLTGDIDRGGVFLQLPGTPMLLDDDERSMVKGLIVNKFRGDKSIFSDGVQMLEQRGEKPVIGVVPYIKCDIEDEDSLSEKLENGLKGIIDIVVIRLPRMSNFTDFDFFSQYEGVSVRYVSKCSEHDMIIIPGTKSTISDMKWLRESGLEAAVKKMRNQPIIQRKSAVLLFLKQYLYPMPNAFQ